MGTCLRLAVSWRLGMPVVSPPSEPGCLECPSPPQREPVPDSQWGWLTPASASHTSLEEGRWVLGSGLAGGVARAPGATADVSSFVPVRAPLREGRCQARREMSHPRAPGKGQEARRTPLSPVVITVASGGFAGLGQSRRGKRGSEPSTASVLSLPEVPGGQLPHSGGPLRLTHLGPGEGSVSAGNAPQGSRPGTLLGEGGRPQAPGSGLGADRGAGAGPSLPLSSMAWTFSLHGGETAQQTEAGTEDRDGETGAGAEKGGHGLIETS